MNRTVTIDEAAIAYGNLSVVISRSAEVSQPDTPFGGGRTVVTDNTQIEMRSDTGSLQRVRTSANLADVVKALNALGATPQDLLSILQNLKSAGALRADLEII
jgi:flagellar P-ring protein precursor FlgI